MVPTIKHALSLPSLAIHIWCSINLTLSHEFDNDQKCKTTATAPKFDKRFTQRTPNSIFDSVQFSHSVMPTLCKPMDCSTPVFPVHQQLLEPTQTHVHHVADANQASHPLSSPSLPLSIFPSIRVFPKESLLHIKWPKYWSFSFSINEYCPSNEYSGLIFFRRTGCLSLLSKGLSRVFSNTTIQKPRFFCPQLSL